MTEPKSNAKRSAAPARSMNLPVVPHRIAPPKVASITTTDSTGDAPTHFAEEVYERAATVTATLSEILSRPEAAHRPGVYE
jgi:hypothetical protein